MATDGRRRVSYFYEEEIGNFYYGAGHPMKPQRIRLAHHLIENYGLYKKMDIFRPHLVTERQMTMFHTDDYVHFLRRISPEVQQQFLPELQKYNMDVDCPIFDGLYEYCQTYSGGSLGGAYRINKGLTDIAINWAGGLHHAKKCEASGFCYVNDIVLGILELLKYHQRVLYIDIDVHHGDGVEEAFYTTDRVMSVSFHKYGDFFPGTGHIDDHGVDQGKNYSINVPLKAGIDDESYILLFRQVMTRVMEKFRPNAIVLQCGADSLCEDRLGCFNLTLKGHGACIEFMRSFDIPMLILGGGGYTIRNVARCWAYETGLCLGNNLPNEIPFSPYYEYFGPDYQLHLTPTNIDNLNTRNELENTLSTILSRLQEIQPAPSVQYSIPIGPSMDNDLLEQLTIQRESQDPNIRYNLLHKDQHIHHDSEMYDGETDTDSLNKRKTSVPQQPPQ